jgi:membrane protease YdiL (CAAX protease family)
LEYQDPIPQDQTVPQLSLPMVAPSAPREIDLIDVALILLVAFGAIFLSTFAAMLVYYGTHHQKMFDPKLLSQNVLFVLPAQLMAYLIVVGFMAFIVAARHSKTLGDAVQWNFPYGRGWLAALGAGAAMGLASQVASSVLSRWIPKTLPIDQYFRDTASAYALAAFGIFIAPLVEELFFRGFLYPALARWTGGALSVIVTAAAFSLLHEGQLAHAWAPLLVLFVVGVALTLVRARTQSVATCVLVHMGYNGALFGMLFYFTDGFRHLERAI